MAKMENVQLCKVLIFSFFSNSMARGKIHCGVCLGVWIFEIVPQNPTETEHHCHVGHSG